MDYVTISQQLVFTNLVRRLCFTIQVIDDTTPELAERFFVMLTSSDDLVQFGVSAIEVTIPINDGENYTLACAMSITILNAFLQLCL